MPTTVVNWRHKPYDVCIMRPSEWGCPFMIGRDGTREEVIEKYKRYLLRTPGLLDKARRELKGLVLGCCCKPLPCHGDVLAELVDEEL